MQVAVLRHVALDTARLLAALLHLGRAVERRARIDRLVQLLVFALLAIGEFRLVPGAVRIERLRFSAERALKIGNGVFRAPPRCASRP